MSILSSTGLGGDNFKMSIGLLIGHGFGKDEKESDRYHEIWRKYNLDGTATKVTCSIDFHGRSPKYFVLPDIKVLDEEPNLTPEQVQDKINKIFDEINNPSSILYFPEYIDGELAVERYVIEVKNAVEFNKAIKKTEELLKVIPKSWL